MAATIRALSQESPRKSSFLPALLGVGERPEMETGEQGWGQGAEGPRCSGFPIMRGERARGCSHCWQHWASCTSEPGKNF